MNYLLNLSLHAFIVADLATRAEAGYGDEEERRVWHRVWQLLSPNTTLEQDYCTLRWYWKCFPLEPLMYTLKAVNIALHEARPEESEQGIPMMLYLQAS